MKTDKFERISFTVNAVQVTLENHLEVAEWCKGTVTQRATRILGADAMLPVILIKGTGDNRGKTFEAALNCWVVELRGSFRSYKPLQFDSAFRAARVEATPEILQEAEEFAAQEPVSLTPIFES